MANYIVFCLISLFFVITSHGMEGNVSNESSDKSTAQELNFYIDGKILTCHLVQKTKLSLCDGSDHVGFLYWDDDLFTAPFLPFIFGRSDSSPFFLQDLFSKKDLKNIINKDNHNYFKEELRFSWEDYFEVDLGNVLKELMLSSVCDTKTLNALNVILLKFIQLKNEIAFKKSQLTKFPLYQEIIFKNGTVQSRFTLQKIDIGEFSEAEITIAGLENHTKAEKQYLESLWRPLDKKALSLNESAKILDEILCQKEIPFAYTADGCYARAHVICHGLTDKGTGKIWIKSNLINPHNPDNRWGYHVAPVIFVDIDGERKLRVIDPTLNKEKLLTEEEWFELMGIKVKPQLIHYPLPKGENSYRNAVYCITSHLPLWPYHSSVNESLESTVEEAKKCLDNFREKLNGETVK